MMTLMTRAGLTAGVIGSIVMAMAASEQSATPPSGASASDPSSKVAWAEVIEAEVDPRIVTNPALADAIRATGLPWRVRDKATGIEMLLVPPGTFNMGMSPSDEFANSDERPAHEVIHSKPFYLGRTEVTQAQWSRVMGSNPSYFQDVNFKPMTSEERAATIERMVAAGFTRQQADTKLGPPIIAPISTANWPVETLTWEDVQLFQERTGLRPPTEAEWEFACRAGTTEPTYGRLDQVAWTTTNSQERTHPVGAKLPNALGFYDMIGNAWEWTNDWYAADYYKACEMGATDPRGPGPSAFRVLRGGSWDYDERSCRASFRLNHFLGDPRITDFGLRIARTP
jgi:formylglycine-generating enzyme required for sulfatase activity